MERLNEYIEEIELDDYLTFGRLIELDFDFEQIIKELNYKGAFYKQEYFFDGVDTPKLQQSLQLAYEIGYCNKNLSVEVLASLLSSQMAREEWYEKEVEIRDILSTLEDEYKEGLND